MPPRIIPEAALEALALVLLLDDALVPEDEVTDADVDPSPDALEELDEELGEGKEVIEKEIEVLVLASAQNWFVNPSAPLNEGRAADVVELAERLDPEPLMVALAVIEPLEIELLVEDEPATELDEEDVEDD
ncbi:hypothetical protein HHX47_DHR3001181 [Lentinula edodes]|nr:hypothetical protein HHX47_DHR3001181 [Lentinula edodes]